MNDHLHPIFREALAPFAPAATEFLIDGARYSLAEVLESNADSPEFCVWARRARPGDVFADIQRVECVAGDGCSDAEPIDRGPLTQPAELTEAEWIEADLAEDANKAERRNRINDAAAMDLERAVQARSEWRLA